MEIRIEFLGLLPFYESCFLTYLGLCYIYVVAL